MSASRPTIEEVDQLLLNAQLRTELEPFWDESVTVVDIDAMPTPRENQYLASLLAWERAPVLPICQWFEKELKLPSAALLDDATLRDILWHTIARLYEKGVVLERTEHLSDRELYCLIQRDILPSPEKKLDLPGRHLRWQCVDPDEDPQTWLRYYATRQERTEWAMQTGQPLPPTSLPPHPRKTPQPDWADEVSDV